MIPLTQGTYHNQIHRDRKSKAGCQALGRQEEQRVVIQCVQSFSFARQESRNWKG